MPLFSELSLQPPRWATIVNTSKESDEFYLKVAYSLGGCQLVEQVLKTYISESLQLARKRGEEVPGFLAKDYGDAPMGPAIRAFRKLSGNDKLADKLLALKSERNKLAHEGVTHCLDPDGELSWPEQGEMKARLHEIECEARTLFDEVHSELNVVRAHLDFDDLTQSDEQA